MKASRIFIASSVLFSMGIIGCSNPEPELSTGTSPTEVTPIDENDALETQLRMLVDIAEKQGSASLIYDAINKTYDVIPEEDYLLFSAIANLIQRDDTRAPVGIGWKYAGKGKTKVQALAMARTVSGQIPEGMDFEVHVEYGDDGYWHVWYRLV